MAKVTKSLSRKKEVVEKQNRNKRLKELLAGDSNKELREDLNDLIKLLIEKKVI